MPLLKACPEDWQTENWLLDPEWYWQKSGKYSRFDLAEFRPGEAFGNAKRRVQGRFEFSGQEYALWVTDPACEKEYLAKLDGTYATGESYLTISLGERYKGACYKLIAAVIGADE